MGQFCRRKLPGYRDEVGQKLIKSCYVIRDRVAFDLPAYDGLLAGHYLRGPGYGRKRPGGTDDWLLVMTLAGSGRFGTATGDYVAVAPGLTLIAPGTTHDYGIHQKASEWEILWVHFHPAEAWLEWLTWGEIAPGIHALAPLDSSEIEGAFREVLRRSLDAGSYRRHFAMNALERLLLLCASQIPDEGPRLDDRIRATVGHIHSDLRLPHTAESLSERVGLSVSRFSHLFKSEMGVSPRQYILQQRVLRGRRLLERTSLGVAEVAHEVGMDAVAFSLRFRADLGVSPRDHRKASRDQSLSET